MATHTIASGICYLEIDDSASVTITGLNTPTTDIPYLMFGNTVYRLTETPTNNTTCYMQTKDIDMSDQNPQYQNMFKTVDRVQLEYVDKSADTPVSVSLSTDGGATWLGTTSKTVGTGNGLSKVTDFWFLQITGKMFRLKIESSSSAKDFVWSGAYIHYFVRGPFFGITA